MKILLIGDKGQVGKEVAELARSNSDTVVGFDIDSLDIADADQVMRIVAEHRDSAVLINAAAYTAVDKAEDEAELAYAVNCRGVEHLALACKQYDLPLLHISTDYVFSGDKVGSYTEDDQPDPVGVYGASKLAGEKLLQETWSRHVILRVSWVFGRYGNNFVKTMLRLAQDRDELNVVGDQFGCPTPAADIARVLLELAQQIGVKQKYGIYHYVGKPVTNWYDFAAKTIDLGRSRFGIKLERLNKITTAEYPTKAKRPQNSELMAAKILTDYGVEQHDWLRYLEDIIREVEL